jgi:glucokinase
VERGCFESHASGEGIAMVARELLERNKKYDGPLRDKASITAHNVFAAYGKGDDLSKSVITEVIEFWGMATANLISLFNPEKIIFGGGVFGPAAALIDSIAIEAKRWTQPIAYQQVTFELSELEGNAALFGAAYSALRAAKVKPSSRPRKN